VKTCVALLVLVLAACGGGSTASPDASPGRSPGRSPGTSPGTSPATARDDSASNTVDPAPPPDSVAGTTAPSDAPATTAPPSSEPFDLESLPELIAAVGDALYSATPDPIPPLGLAMALGGFPLEIPAPEGSALYDITARFQGVEQGTRETSFEYRVVGPGGAVPDVDLNLDDNGPGSLQLIDVYDPVMTALGFSRTNSTASDPGGPGGPNSVNHVYVPTEPVGTFNGVTGSTGNVFVWADEDINGGSYSGDPILAGYRIEVDVDTVDDDSPPVPLLDALAATLPTPEAARLVAGELRLQRRPPDSFTIDRGEFYIALVLEWEASAEMFDDIVAFYADGSVITPPLLPAAASFFDEGEYEPAEMSVYNGTDHHLDLLLLERYPGLLAIEAPAEPGAPVVMRLDVDLDSIAPPLSAPAG
jgi:hypothetical protein